MLGQLSFGFIVDRWSRKMGMLISSGFLVVCSIMSATAIGVTPGPVGVVSFLSFLPFLLSFVWFYILYPFGLLFFFFGEGRVVVDIL